MRIVIGFYFRLQICNKFKCLHRNDIKPLLLSSCIAAEHYACCILVLKPSKGVITLHFARITYTLMNVLAKDAKDQPRANMFLQA